MQTTEKMVPVTIVKRLRVSKPINYFIFTMLSRMNLETSIHLPSALFVTFTMVYCQLSLSEDCAPPTVARSDFTLLNPESCYVFASAIFEFSHCIELPNNPSYVPELNITHGNSQLESWRLQCRIKNEISKNSGRKTDIWINIILHDKFCICMP